jgi:ABC-2 type transport system permease protein
VILIKWLFEYLQRRFGGGESARPVATDEPTLTVGARAMQLELANVATIARREYVTRGRTRAFRLVTVLLVVAALAVSLAPILIPYVSRSSGSTAIEVEVGDTKPAVDPARTIETILNAEAGSTGASTSSSSPAYSVTTTTDDAGARARVDSGQSGGLLILSRDPTTGLLGFTFVTKAKTIDRISQFMAGAATDLAHADLLAKSVPPQTQALLATPPSYVTQLPNGQPGNTSAESFVNQFAAGFVLSVMLFIAIIVYGQWVALSVAEEKSSRVMEVILGAASPFELLAGKVIGVGGLALTQYVIIFIPAMIGILLQGQIASLVFGGPPGSISLPAGLSPGLLLVFGVVFVLGFAFYAVIYAGVASLISRTEDMQQIVAPMSLIAAAGYLVAVYSTTGLISSDSRLVTVMTFIPFWSPVLVLTRLGAGTIDPPQAIVALVILAISVPVALRIAARVYAAGVLLYGQRPGLRLLARALRGT